MNSKYNVLIKYSGDGEFKFSIKKLGEVSISKDKPVYIYNADVETINNLRTLRRMLIEITIGGKPTGAYKIYNLDEYTNEKNTLLTSSTASVDKRGVTIVTNNDVSSILKSGSNGPIEVEEIPKIIETNVNTDTKKSTKKSISKKTSKK